MQLQDGVALCGDRTARYFLDEFPEVAAQITPCLETEIAEAYFSRHAGVAATESDQALALLLAATPSREDQERAIEAVTFKCDVLGALLDAIDAVR